MMILPDDTIPEVLSRLPGKSLMRFKCVCKHWFSLITSSPFIKSHLSRSRLRSRGVFVIIGRASGYKSKPRFFFTDLGKEPINKVNFYEDPSPAFTYNHVSNVVDGLVCFYEVSSSDVITFIRVYNIVTCEFLTLPCPPSRYPDPPIGRVITLCFDSICEEYKLVNVYWGRIGNSYTNPYVGCEVLTIFGEKENTWRTIDIIMPLSNDPVFCRRIGDKYGFYHDGVVHLFRREISKNTSVFNVHCEKFENFEFPTEYRSYRTIKICDVERYLSIVVVPPHSDHDFPGNKIEINLWRQMGGNGSRDQLAWTNEIIKCPFNNYMQKLVKYSNFGLMSLVMSSESETGLVIIECFDLTTREHTQLKLYNVEGFLCKTSGYAFEPSILVDNLMHLKKKNNIESR